MKKKISLIIIACVALIGFVSCRKEDKIIEMKTQVITSAFENNDMEMINKTIFGTTEFKVDEELLNIWEENSQAQEGVLASIFELVTVEVKKTTDTKIKYKIKAPNMKNVFENVNEKISENELLEYIKNYAKNAETKETTVSLEYILVDDELIVDYQNEEFINAVTGGLLDAYKILYSEMIKEYAEGVK